MLASALGLSTETSRYLADFRCVSLSGVKIQRTCVQTIIENDAGVDPEGAQRPVVVSSKISTGKYQKSLIRRPSAAPQHAGAPVWWFIMCHHPFFHVLAPCFFNLLLDLFAGL